MLQCTVLAGEQPSYRLGRERLTGLDVRDGCNPVNAMRHPLAEWLADSARRNHRNHGVGPRNDDRFVR